MVRVGAIAIVDARFGLLQIVEANTMINLIGPITVPRGDSFTFRLTVTDDTDARVDLAGAAIEFQIKQALDGADPPLVSKSVGDGITLLAQSGDTLGQADIAGLPADTATLASGLYYADIVLIEISGQRTHVIAPRAFTIGSVVNS